MTISTSKVAVLGLGRMGGAIAQRLVEQGWVVSGWSRSGRAPTGLFSVAEPSAAVRDSGVVVLALFDGEACAEVLERCRSALSAGTVVVNTSTVAPAEAAAFEKTVQSTGAAYIHAPVMGSVPAAHDGTLRVLVGSSTADVGAADDLLADIGEVILAGGVVESAALKLVANGALGSALLAVRDARRYAVDLGISPGAALDVLERGALGSIVKGKRDRPSQPASFTSAALAKDLALLAAETPSAQATARQVADLVASGAVAPDDDVFSLTEPAARSEAPDEVLEPLRAYVRGHATGDPQHFRAAFLPSAHVEGLRDGEFVSWSLDDYCELFTGSPAVDEATRQRTIDQVFVDGSVATAVMTLRHGADTFTDVFLLLHTADGWRIANKAYHRRHPDLGQPTSR
jgi:3-hydroxyisobutyrate dehydrogenase-like beta-hydroxyacid dehydrogenase